MCRVNNYNCLAHGQSLFLVLTELGHTDLFVLPVQQLIINVAGIRYARACVAYCERTLRIRSVFLGLAYCLGYGDK